MLDVVLLSACHDTRLSVGSKLEYAEDVLPWVYAAGKLLRSKHERLCSKNDAGNGVPDRFLGMCSLC